MPKKSYKVISILLKVLIVAGTTAYIFSRITRQDYIDAGFMIRHFRSSPAKILLVSGVFLLMLANWLLESRKWQLLVRNIEPLSLLRSLQSVFCGVTFAVFTPNRVGEFGGRVLQLEEGHRIKGSLASFTGSIAQLVVTIVTGSVALLVYLRYDRTDQLAWPLFTVIGLLVLALNMLLVLFYLNSRLFIKLLWNTWLFHRVKKYLMIFRAYTHSFLSVILLLSLARYIIFVLQFYFLLVFVDVEIPFSQGIYLIALMYLISTVVPTFAISEVTTRGSVSVMLLGAVAGNPLQITGAYFLLWLINLALPALIGSIFVLRIRFFRNREKG